ncbi:hypothetical protein CV102_15505 [Natronococcus pandeyae]|uniref:DUF8027 domain-containing protein n=1 Tax=Natronococcus pandeyae TaxID=2055836 RepID=A0A8J8Q3F2_9EURY|nr:hypothetical protein [Natronococcus pandeyae]TYL37743.1 hypothetical protein CV102_15505 [Natronococcus pandeyae]
MPVPGYDPEDIDDTLESLLEDDEIEQHLSDSELEAYRNGEVDLVDLLDGDEIRHILERKDASIDVPD